MSGKLKRRSQKFDMNGRGDFLRRVSADLPTESEYVGEHLRDLERDGMLKFFSGHNFQAGGNIRDDLSVTNGVVRATVRQGERNEEYSWTLKEEET